MSRQCADAEPVPGATTRVRLHYAGRCHEIQVPRHQPAAATADSVSAPVLVTVLDAAERAGIDLPYSCCSGVCATCCARVTRGTVEHLENHVLDSDDLAAGFVLVCQALPTSAALDIDYDGTQTPNLLPMD